MNFRYISPEYPLILASISPRRRHLLLSLGIPFRVIPSDVKEGDGKGYNPEEFALNMARKKAEKVFNKIKDGWILGADTIVLVDDQILGKPRDYEEAKSMLIKLSGREHVVITGFCIIGPSGRTYHMESVRSEVMIRRLQEEEIKAYLETKEPFDKAGAYAVQGIGAFMIKGIKGSYTNVVGLPLCEVILALKRVGALSKFP